MEFVESGPEALEIMSKTVFNIIVADYKMPIMNGLELLKEVKEKYPAIKRILLTGQSETEVYEEAKNLVDKYIAKPCDHDELISILKKI